MGYVIKLLRQIKYVLNVIFQSHQAVSLAQKSIVTLSLLLKSFSFTMKNNKNEP